MKLEGIINVTGKTGLFKVVSRTKNSVIVESLLDNKRTPLYSNHQANMLDEIGIYTYEETKSLNEIFEIIAKKEDYKQTISHKSLNNELISYFREILEDYDEERVYISDIKKVIQWYNLLQAKGLIKVEKNNKEKNNNGRNYKNTNTTKKKIR